MDTYERFRTKIGPHCAFCKQAAKHMLIAETARSKDFQKRLETGNWDGYN
jgi:bacterioferritin-associated ferredoxin